MKSMEGKSKDTPLISHELGKFTWSNPDQPNQKGWKLEEDIRSIIADGGIEYLVLALDNSIVKTDGGLGGIEISFNTPKSGFCMDFKSFPWNWDSKSQTGGYTSYNDLIAGGYASVDSGIIKLRYYIKSHPKYSAFKSEVEGAEWAEISIQYGIGIRILPLLNSYLQG